MFFWLLDWMLFDLGSVFDNTLGWWVLLDNRAQWSNEVVYDAKSRPNHWNNVSFAISLWCKHFESHRGPWLGHMWATMTVNVFEYMSRCKLENWTFAAYFWFHNSIVRSYFDVFSIVILFMCVEYEQSCAMSFETVTWTIDENVSFSNLGWGLPWRKV